MWVELPSQANSFKTKEDAIEKIKYLQRLLPDLMCTFEILEWHLQ